jgi:N-acetylglucosamine malate deacetylase 1
VLDRRSFLLAGAAPALLAIERSAKPLKVVCVGAHPDDPESGCAGTLARYAAEGHKVTVVYLTRGERGITGKSLDEAAKIRTAEAEAACKILGATPRFVGQIDGDTEVNAARIRTFTALIRAEAPDIVLAHWPIDTHPDHQAASMLAIRAYCEANPKFVLYFFEVNSGFQSMGFKPTHYVDITAVREKKKAVLFAHKSQDGEGIYREHHEIMENYRGREGGVVAAEAFVRLARDGKVDLLPGI